MAEKKFQNNITNNNVSKNHEDSFDRVIEEDNEDDESFPETQPVELLDVPEALSEDLFEEMSCNDIWGWLHPTQNSKMPPIALRKNIYTFGRCQCDYVFESHHFQDENIFSGTSKTQFKLERERVNEHEEMVFMSDLSRNGTFVNNQKIRQGERVILLNNDKISIVFPNIAVFVFIDDSFIRRWMPSKMIERFNLKDSLGKGAYGEVRMAHDKVTRRNVAIKKMKNCAGIDRIVSNEIQILRKLKHTFIVSMEDVFDTPDYVFIILEYISGGTLRDRVNNCGSLIDDEAKYIFYQLVLALEYLHQEGVAHRDLKPDNVLIARYKEGDIVKVADFGLSKLINDTDLKTMCGTPLFTAPEVLQTRSMGTYTLQVDIWSLGVTLFFCLSGTHPFSDDRTGMSVFEQIVRGSYSMKGPEWQKVNSDAAQLTRKMLVVDPTKRIHIPEILQHQWLQDKGMKDKLNKVMKSATEGNDNLSANVIEPSPKRARLATPSDTINKS